MREVLTKSAEETMELGRQVLRQSLKSAKKGKPLIFCLSGELGAGKTYFVKGMGEALNITAIRSPTFVLMKKFKIAGQALRQAQGKQYFFHIDCYRIYDTEDARQIGLDKIILNPRAIIAIEWAERIEELIAKPYWRIEFKYEEEEKRRISIYKKA